MSDGDLVGWIAPLETGKTPNVPAGCKQLVQITANLGNNGALQQQEGAAYITQTVEATAATDFNFPPIGIPAGYYFKLLALQIANSHGGSATADAAVCTATMLGVEEEATSNADPTGIEFADLQGPNLSAGFTLLGTIPGGMQINLRVINPTGGTWVQQVLGILIRDAFDQSSKNGLIT